MYLCKHCSKEATQKIRNKSESAVLLEKMFEEIANEDVDEDSAHSQ